MIENNQWLTCYKPNPKAHVRIFCFPYAGSGGSVFRTWAADLPTWIEVCPVQLPGRENRIQEKSFETIKELITPAAEALMPYFDLPFVFFGHSMGAWIAYEMACYLRENINLIPKHLFVSGRYAPDIADSQRLHLLSEKDFKQQLKTYNGTPSAVLQHEELMQIIVPILRADFSVCETYLYTPREALECPISVFSGKDDHIVNEEGLYAWKKHTSNEFRIEIFPGDHFFLRNVQKDLIRSIVSDLGRYE